jgi:hypothetical protein
MSAEDIDKGERWSIDIAKQLEETNFGIICMTPENMTAPWVLFEAGALSKSIERSRVSPLLFGLSPSDFSKSPLLQFQLTVFKQDEILKLLQSINNSSSETERLRDDVLQVTFARSWGDLASAISQISFTNDMADPGKPVDSPSTNDKVNEILEELLSIGRAQTKLLRTPEEIFPPEYLTNILRKLSGRDVPPNHPAWRRALEGIEKLRVIIENIEQQEEAKKLIDEVLRHLAYIRRRDADRGLSIVPYPLRPDARDFDIDMRRSRRMIEEAEEASRRLRQAEEAAHRLRLAEEASRHLAQASRIAEEAEEEAARAAEEAEE